MVNEHLRQTGRTTRMLKAAMEAHETGLFVYVVVATERHKYYFLDKLEKLKYDYKKRPPITLITPQHPHLDIQRLEMLGMPSPKYAVFADHLALENYYATVLGELHRYDE